MKLGRQYSDYLYYTEHGRLDGGKIVGGLSREWGLEGQTSTAQQYERLQNGQHPFTGEQLIRLQKGHRLGWDGVISAPKSVSIAAMVGGDARVREAHDKAVAVAVREAEKFMQAHRKFSNEVSGQWIAFVFPHDLARPVKGYPPPQLHTHCVVFNITKDERGYCAAETKMLHEAQNYLQAVYRNELAANLVQAGYELTRGVEESIPEIKGISRQYIEHESPGEEKVQRKREATGRELSREEQLAAAREAREDKLRVPPEQIRRMQVEHGAQYRRELEKTLEHAMHRRMERSCGIELERSTAEAVTMARNVLMERSATIGERELSELAFNYAQGKARSEDVRTEINRQVSAGKFIEVEHVALQGGMRQFTTPEMIHTERETLAAMMRGLDSVKPMRISARVLENYKTLNEDQKRAVEMAVASRHQITGIQGRAGAGKSYALRAANDVAKDNGYTVWGLGPTGRAANNLTDANLQSETLQKFIARGCRLPKGLDEKPTLYLLDEASLASAKQVELVATSLRKQDRLVLIGDTRQHNAVESGAIFRELQDAGMPVITMGKIMRQKDSPELLKAVQSLSEGQTAAGMQQLANMGKISQVPDRAERIQAIAKDYADSPEKTLIISPDNKSRLDLNAAVREKLREKGLLSNEDVRAEILIQRPTTGAERAHVRGYQVDDVVWYRRGSKELGIESLSRAVVIGTDDARNRLRVRRQDGTEIEYDPRRLKGVSIYTAEQRNFSVGDKIQYTAPISKKAVVNRDIATITCVEPDGKMTAKLARDGRLITINLNENPHVDHAYSMTSISAQSVTVDRVLVHIEAQESRLRSLVNGQLAYVGVSRAARDARIYCDSEPELARTLAHSELKTMALSAEQIERYAERTFSVKDIGRTVENAKEKLRREAIERLSQSKREAPEVKPATPAIERTRAEGREKQRERVVERGYNHGMSR